MELLEQTVLRTGGGRFPGLDDPTRSAQMTRVAGERRLAQHLLRGTWLSLRRRMLTKLNSSLLNAGIGSLWLLAVAVGVSILWRYETTPGGSGAPQADWPSESEIPREEQKATLVMLAHPHCPCTRASVAELAKVMADAQGKAQAYVLFLKRQNSTEDLVQNSLWKRASNIPGVTVLTDTEGREARRFNLETSGHTLLFNSEGRLMFSGGITASRGHEGDNAGGMAILAALSTGTMDRPRTSVFGCPLLDPEGQ